jgi:Zn-dependent protease with chaperone function/tetratricopeptide (TPR) repeat protein
MLLPRHVTKPSVRRIPSVMRQWGSGLVCAAVLMGCVILRADAQLVSKPAPTADPFEVTTRQPLSSETWHLWREVYTRIFFEDLRDPDQEKKFYEHVERFLRATAAESGGSLPKQFASDPIAWVALAWHYLRRAGDDAPGAVAREQDLAQAEDAGRKGIALGDPQAIASYSLASILVYRALFRGSNKPLTGEMERRLAQAEERLQYVERTSPRANVNLPRGQIAQLRGNTKDAVSLLSRATEEHPHSSQTAIAYLMTAMPAADSSARLADLTGPFAARFPKDPSIQVLHAGALYKDERFPEAAEVLRRARELDEKAARRFGDQHLKAIEEGRLLTPKAASGLKAMRAKQYDTAAAAFRQALTEDPRNYLAARWLARALTNQLVSSPHHSVRPAAVTVASEVGELCRRFPEDAELQAALSVALHLSGRDIEAGRALDRIQRLGARPEKFIDPEGVLVIRHDAGTDETTRFWQSIARAAVGAAALWIATMFALGAVLAACIPRVPKSVDLTGQSRSRWEIWLERFYLLVLSLGLLIFYASVPVVALGVLAVTLALFGLFLVLRVIHFGVLYRGLWATWNVLRCALIGPNREVLGIKASGDKHPLLFEASRAVAERLETRAVDTIYLTPSSNISVHQEGSGPFGLLGKRQRVLEIGISTLPLLTREEFNSILAHEYGHFTHKDTFYTRFIFQVSASLATSLAVMNAAGGVLNYVNPFYWFWWLYLRAYTLLATGFSRPREFLADRRAAAVYGKQALVSGLTKVAVDGVLFESTVYANVLHLLSQGKAFTNAFDAFRHFREGTEMVESRERLLEKMRQTRPKWFDTHPTLSERLAAVADFPDVASAAETGPAIELLSDYQAVEADLTEVLTCHIHRISRDQENRSQDLVTGED